MAWWVAPLAMLLTPGLIGLVMSSRLDRGSALKLLLGSMLAVIIATAAIAVTTPADQAILAGWRGIVVISTLVFAAGVSGRAIYSGTAGAVLFSSAMIGALAVLIPLLALGTSICLLFGSCI